MGIKDYNVFRKKIQKATLANLDLRDYVKDIDSEDVRYMFMEDPDLMIMLGNYKTTAKLVLDKI